MKSAVLLFVATLLSASVLAFQLQQSHRARASLALFETKGFGSKQAKREKSEGQKKREVASSKYDEIASTGGQQYNIFVRQFGSDDKSWLPCGAVAVPRNAQVSDAIFSNQAELNQAIVRLFPKLNGMEQEFEYGYNLKVYPDDPIQVAVKTSPKAQFSVGNWINNLLSPVDTSQVKKE